MSDYLIHKAQFNFRREYFRSGHTHNIPGFTVAAGHGYDLRTCMCVGCGALVVVDHELLQLNNKSLSDVVHGLQCLSCSRALVLVQHPEHVWSNGHAVVPDDGFGSSDPSTTELLEVYTISQR